MGQKGKNRNMLLNIGDKKTRFLLSLAKTPLLFYPHYKYHLPLPSVLMIENTNHCNAECVMCPRDTLSRKRGFMVLGISKAHCLAVLSLFAILLLQYPVTKVFLGAIKRAAPK